eukprot:TRINITY_DN2136_c0_g1_i1.p1 TRINITY_DN2136_c0_g1~~TRINITY_DN2136_c0_g1_i1.p1  ORF type:complete len:97 (-),score=29.83 TRINITY_DN2136_c0_g1_i1:34-324(-)
MLRGRIEEVSAENAELHVIQRELVEENTSLKSGLAAEIQTQDALNAEIEKYKDKIRAAQESMKRMQSQLNDYRLRAKHFEFREREVAIETRKRRTR